MKLVKLISILLITKIILGDLNQEISEETQIANIIKDKQKTSTRTAEETQNYTEDHLNESITTKTISISNEEISSEEDIQIEERKKVFLDLKKLQEVFEKQFRKKQKKDKKKNVALKFLYNRVNYQIVLDLEFLCLKSDIDYKICMEFSQHILISLSKIPYRLLLENVGYVGIVIKIQTLKKMEFWPIYDLIETTKVFIDSSSEAISQLLEFKGFFNDKIY